MALTHLLDTSVYSQPVRDVPHEQVLDRWSLHRDESLAVSAVVHAEILQGLKKRGSDKFWRRYRALLEDRYVILPFDRAAAETYSRLVVQTENAGKPRPMADLMIAATAMTHGLIVATLNTKDFTGIPGLRVEDWGSPQEEKNTTTEHAQARELEKR